MRSEYIERLSGEVEAYLTALEDYAGLDMERVKKLVSARNEQAKAETQRLRGVLDERISETNALLDKNGEDTKKLQGDLSSVQEERRKREAEYRSELAGQIERYQKENDAKTEENKTLHSNAVQSIGALVTYERTAEASQEKAQKIQTGKTAVYQVFSAINKNTDEIRKNESEIAKCRQTLNDQEEITRRCMTAEETDLQKELQQLNRKGRELEERNAGLKQERKDAHDACLREAQAEMEQEDYVWEYREKLKNTNALLHQAEYPQIMTLLNMMISYGLERNPAPDGLSALQKELFESLCDNPLLGDGVKGNEEELARLNESAMVRFFFTMIPDLTELPEEKKAELPGVLTDRFLETLQECCAHSEWEMPDAAYAVAEKLGVAGNEQIQLMYKLQHATLEDTMTLEQIYYQRKREERERRQEERDMETARQIREEARRQTRIMEQQAEEDRRAAERMEEENRRHNEQMAWENRQANARMEEENRRANEEFARESRRANEERERLQREANMESQRHNREMEWNARQSARQQSTGASEPNPAYCVGCKRRRTCGHLGKPLGHCYVDY